MTVAVALEQLDPVPDWTWLPLTQARMTSNFLDVLVLRRMTFSRPVEHKDVPSAFLVSRPIRQVAYGLLLGTQSQWEVEEWARVGLKLEFMSIQAAFSGVTQRLNLRSLHKVRKGC